MPLKKKKCFSHNNIILFSDRDFCFSYVLAVATVHGDDEASSEDDAVEYERPTISVYDLTSLNLICVFVEPDDGVSRMIQEPSRYFSHVQFLQSDDTFAVALAINHDGSGCSVYYYKWTDSTVDTCLRIDDHRVVDVSTIILL